ncbi:hypothetical protein FRB93_007329 [Tulasnella sp. JGI-2019a]|nr:hypothetical protein FRB93_007329 [Tulasnella sp. JGI-2019a]
MQGPYHSSNSSSTFGGGIRPELHHWLISHWMSLKAVSAFDLGVDLWSRFQQIGHRSDLDESITYHREALNLRPEGHPCRSVSLSYLAVGLHTRFQQTEDKGDIDECIKYIFL